MLYIIITTIDITNEWHVINLICVIISAVRYQLHNNFYVISRKKRKIMWFPTTSSIIVIDIVPLYGAFHLLHITYHRTNQLVHLFRCHAHSMLKFMKLLSSKLKPIIQGAQVWKRGKYKMSNVNPCIGLYVEESNLPKSCCYLRIKHHFNTCRMNSSQIL